LNLAGKACLAVCFFHPGGVPLLALTSDDC